MLIIISSTTAATKLIVSVICAQLNLGHLAPCGGHEFELPTINCEFNKRNFIVSPFFLSVTLCVFTWIIFIFVYHCTHERMSYVLNSYLLTYLHHC